MQNNNNNTNIASNSLSLPLFLRSMNKTGILNSLEGRSRDPISQLDYWKQQQQQQQFLRWRLTRYLWSGISMSNYPQRREQAGNCNHPTPITSFAITIATVHRSLLAIGVPFANSCLLHAAKIPTILRLRLGSSATFSIRSCNVECTSHYWHDDFTWAWKSSSYQTTIVEVRGISTVSFLEKRYSDQYHSCNRRAFVVQASNIYDSWRSIRHNEFGGPRFGRRVLLGRHE